MRATHWLIGCALCIAGIGSAGATSMDTRDLDSAPRTTTDSNGGHGENTGSGGDVVGLTRDCPPTGSSDSSGSTSSTGNDRSGGASSAPTPTRRPHLGWQSLLPGSIQ
ncbi:MAG: hypothetical protein ACYC0F_08895 [Rhodanobacter sp.]